MGCNVFRTKLHQILSDRLLVATRLEMVNSIQFASYITT